eukprot:scaffold162460_cov21-Tisochrysis_lutea.AAC.1
MAVISKHIKVIEISGAQLMRKRSRVGRGEGIKIIKRHSIAFIVSQARKAIKCLSLHLKQ